MPHRGDSNVDAPMGCKGGAPAEPECACVHSALYRQCGWKRTNLETEGLGVVLSPAPISDMAVS